MEFRHLCELGGRVNSEPTLHVTFHLHVLFSYSKLNLYRIANTPSLTLNDFSLTGHLFCIAIQISNTTMSKNARHFSLIRIATNIYQIWSRNILLAFATLSTVPSAIPPVTQEVKYLTILVAIVLSSFWEQGFFNISLSSVNIRCISHVVSNRCSLERTDDRKSYLLRNSLGIILIGNHIFQ